MHIIFRYSCRKQATPDLPRPFENYRLALKFDPEHRGANEYIGEAYLMDKNPAKALQLLQLTEQESYLAEAYAQSASQDKQIAAEFEATLADGLVNAQNTRTGAHAAW